MIFMYLIVFPDFRELASWAHSDDLNAIKSHFEWHTVMGVCSRWRKIAIESPTLWRTVLSVSGSVHGLNLNDTDNVRWPGPRSPLLVYLDAPDLDQHRKRQRRFLTKLLHDAPKTQPVYIAIDEKSVDQLTDLVHKSKTCLRALSVTRTDAEADSTFAVHDSFRSLEALSLRYFHEYTPLQLENLLRLNLSGVSYDLAGLESLVKLLLAAPMLDHLSFEDARVRPKSKDIAIGRRNRLVGSRIKQITFTTTYGVATLLACIGIPAGARLVMHDIEDGDILPHDVQRPFLGTTRAKAYVEGNQVRVIVKGSECELEGFWTVKERKRTPVLTWWTDGPEEILGDVDTFKVYGKGSQGIREICACASSAQRLIFDVSDEDDLESAISDFGTRALFYGGNMSANTKVVRLEFAARYGWHDVLDRLIWALKERKKQGVAPPDEINIFVGRRSITSTSDDLTTRRWEEILEVLMDTIKHVRVRDYQLRRQRRPRVR